MPSWSESAITCRTVCVGVITTGSRSTPRLVALHLGDLARPAAAAVKFLWTMPMPPFLRHGDREAGLGHCIHRSGDQREIQRDVAGEPGGEGGVLGKDLGERWHQQHVVEGERFAEKAHG